MTGHVAPLARKPPPNWEGVFLRLHAIVSDMRKNVSRETFTEIVDLILVHKGTPREKLFEYPYRDDESAQLIRGAEYLARAIIERVAKEIS